MWYSNLAKKSILFSIYPPPTVIHFSHCFSSASKLLFQPLPHLRFNLLVFSETLATKVAISRPSCEPLYETNTSQRKQEVFLYEYILQRVRLQIKDANRTLLFGSSLLKHGRHFDYWNQPVNLRMRVCYLDCHEAGLCCYLVIHIGNLLSPLHLFYFHLWPIYWLCPRKLETKERNPWWWNTKKTMGWFLSETVRIRLWRSGLQRLSWLLQALPCPVAERALHEVRVPYCQTYIAQD
jgi:hypothetical protein